MKDNSTLPLWENIYHWLGSQKIDVNKDYIREELNIQPDYPALSSVMDFLESGGRGIFFRG